MLARGPEGTVSNRRWAQRHLRDRGRSPLLMETQSPRRSSSGLRPDGPAGPGRFWHSSSPPQLSLLSTSRTLHTQLPQARAGRLCLPLSESSLLAASSHLPGPRGRGTAPAGGVTRPIRQTGAGSQRCDWPRNPEQGWDLAPGFCCPGEHACGGKGCHCARLQSAKLPPEAPSWDHSPLSPMTGSCAEGEPEEHF